MVGECKAAYRSSELYEASCKDESAVPQVTSSVMRCDWLVHSVNRISVYLRCACEAQIHAIAYEVRTQSLHYSISPNKEVKTLTLMTRRAVDDLTSVDKGKHSMEMRLERRQSVRATIDRMHCHIHTAEMKIEKRTTDQPRETAISKRLHRVLEGYLEGLTSILEGLISNARQSCPTIH